MKLVLVLLLVSAVAAQRVSSQRETSSDMTYNPNWPGVLPKICFDFLEEFNWGDFHQLFHMARRWDSIPVESQNWLRSVGVPRPPYQEGNRLNGIEFLVMHRSMIRQLRDLFGDEQVTNDPDGYTTMNQVLDGWTTDEQVIRGLQRHGANVDTFRRALHNVNNFDQFPDEDSFGNFLQTHLRPGQDDTRPGAGVHNWLHGAFKEEGSPISVTSARSNLANILFWRIHGWIEAKWVQFEKSRTRSPAEQRDYDRFIQQFDTHMDSMSQGVQSGSDREEAARAEAARAEAARDEAAKLERDRIARREAEARRIQEAEEARRVQLEAEAARRAKEEADRLARDRERRATELARQERERKAQETERKAAEVEAKRKADEEAATRRRESEERRVAEEAERKRNEAAEKKAREDEAHAREQGRIEDERIARERADSLAREEAIRKLRVEEDRKKREAADLKAAADRAAADREASQRSAEARRLAEEAEAKRAREAEELARQESLRQTSASPAPTAAPAAAQEMCARTNMNVRSGPSTRNSIVFTARKGTKVTVDRSKTHGAWLYVTPVVGSRTSGYSFFKEEWWGACADEVHVFHAQHLCPKTAMNVRFGPSMNSNVLFVAHQGRSYVARPSKRVRHWLHVSDGVRSGYSYYTPKYWGKCSTTQRHLNSIIHSPAVAKMEFFKTLLRKAYRDCAKVPEKIVVECEPFIFTCPPTMPL